MLPHLLLEIGDHQPVADGLSWRRLQPREAFRTTPADALTEQRHPLRRPRYLLEGPIQTAGDLGQVVLS